MNNNNKRNSAQFKDKLALFVRTGRYFASPIQFAQVMNTICSQWSVQITHTNNSIRCHYSVSSNKQQNLHPDISKRRKTHSNKTNFNCPFCIRYTIPGFVQKSSDPAWKPRIMYQVIFGYLLFLVFIYQLDHLLTLCFAYRTMYGFED